MDLHQQDTDDDGGTNVMPTGEDAPARRTDYGRKYIPEAVLRVLKYRTVIGSCEIAQGVQIEKAPDLYISILEAIHLEKLGAENVEIHFHVTPEDECALAWNRYQARKKWEEDFRPDGWTQKSERLYKQRDEQEARKAAQEKKRQEKAAANALTRAKETPSDVPEGYIPPENSVLDGEGVGELLARLGAEDAARRRVRR